MVKCPKCGREVQDGSSFCTNCGAKLEAPVPAPAPSAPAFCTVCGKPLNPGARFCVGCGAKVGAMPPPGPAPAGEPVNAPAEPSAPTPPAEPAPEPTDRTDAPAGGGNDIPSTGPADAPAGGGNDIPPAGPADAPAGDGNDIPSAGPADAPTGGLAEIPSGAWGDTTTGGWSDTGYGQGQPGGFPPPQGRPESVQPAEKKPVSPLMIVLPVIAVLILLAGFFGWRWYSQHIVRARELMETASEYLDAGNYRQAEETFLELVELRPGSADAVMGLARACLYQEKYSDAVRYLEDLNLSESDGQYGDYQRLLSVARFDPELAEINTDHFPRIDVTLRCKGDLQPEQREISVSEDGTAYDLSDYTSEKGSFTLSYVAPDTEFSDEQRWVDVSLNLDGFTFSQSRGYYTPHFEQARVVMTSADVSRYPIVTAYFRVEDPYSGEAIEGLDVSSFRISESLQGGEYLSREVHSAQPLEGNLGLSIDLVADKSSSISDYDMQKIKSVMTSFVNSLHYGEGDKAEVLAFDSIVQQMCYYTNDTALLVNGINNMSTDGRTALYNAIHDGIHNAALQGGARCVIAFTDGMDNESWYTPYEIVQYANDNQVPVYIIGVGYEASRYEYDLRTVAEGTGGRYWFIDDLYDLQQIFNEIYSMQKKLYAVEYVSADSADAYDIRNLDVTVSGSGYRAREQMSFQAVRSVSGQTHASRYELVKGALNWEDAAKRCQEMGGHLATITSQGEMDQLISMAESAGLKYIWLGGYTSYDSYGNVFGHWVTGEGFSYQHWSAGEPSRVDLDGMDEWYIMLWNVPSLGGWTWNDQRNDPAAAVPSMANSMGFICEYEN